MAGFGPRIMIPLTCSQGDVELRIHPIGGPSRIVIEEIGLYSSDRGPIGARSNSLTSRVRDSWNRGWWSSGLPLLAGAGLLGLALIRTHVGLYTSAFCGTLTALAFLTTLGIRFDPLLARGTLEPLRFEAAKPTEGWPAITLAPAPEPEPLPLSLWTPVAGTTIEVVDDGLLVDTNPLPSGYSLSVPLRIPTSGVYRFVLEAQPLDGGLQLGLLSGDAKTWLVFSDGHSAPEPVELGLEAMLAEGQTIQVIVSNHRYPDGGSSNVRIESLKALRSNQRPAAPVGTLIQRDLRTHLAAGPLQECAACNLAYGLNMGSNLLQGHGPVAVPGDAPWERMPGYGFFCALAGLLAGSSALLPIAINTIFLQLLLTALAAALFGAAASRIMSPLAAALAVSIFVLAPPAIWHTLVEGLMPAIALLILAAGCRYLERRRAGKISLSTELLLHGGFALWFLCRPDVVVGWAAVSLVFCWRRWRYLAIPLSLVLLIGLSWGGFKYRLGSEFSMTTKSSGAVLFLGLWEVPHRFVWEASDSSYHAWWKANRLAPASVAADRLLKREVVRFYLTYPGYVAVVVFNELVDFAEQMAFQNVTLPIRPLWRAQPPVMALLPGVSLSGPFVWGLLAVTTLAIVTGRRRRQTMLLGWAVWFNLPLYFLIYSSGGRFYRPAVLGLLVASCAVLFDRGFWTQLLAARARVVAVCAVFLLLALFGSEIDRFLLSSERLRYGTPFLDPANSTLSVLAPE